MDKKKLSWFSLIVFGIVILVNYLTATGNIGGILPQKEVSKLYKTPITPAGFTFSIWGLIYLLLFGAIVYMIKTSSDRGYKSDIVNQISMPLLGVFIFNLAWNIVFGMKLIGISVIMILGYWISLIVIGFKLSNSKNRLNPIIPLAFGIHTGWITIASIVNFYAFLVEIKYNGIVVNSEFWAVIGIILAIGLVAVLQFLIRNAILPLATAWAFFGIYAKDGVSYINYPFIPIMLLLGIVLLMTLSIITFIKNKNSLLPN